MHVHAPYRTRRATIARGAVLWLLAGCAPPPPAPPPAAPPPPPPYVFPHRVVWTAAPGIELVTDSARVAVSRPFTALEVVQADSLSLLVRCPVCPQAPLGRVPMEDVVFAALPPAEAAHGDLAAFALAVREAARRHDVAALRPVMAPDFTFSFVGTQGAETALAAWEAERFATLDRVPALLDHGLATRDSLLWAAPPEHFERLDYRGLRVGFRRTPEGQWRWVFLVRSEVPG